MSSKRKGNIYLGSVKRKKSVMTLTEKVELLDLLKSGKSAAAVGRHYGINESTVRYIKKQENEIRKVVLVTPAISAKTLHQIRNTFISRTENDTFIWIQDCRKKDIPLNSNMIMKKAKSIYDAMKTEHTGEGRGKESDFSASKGWLDNFTRRFGLSKSSKMKNVVNSADKVEAKDFPAFLDVIVEENGFSPKQLFNVNERGKGFTDKVKESNMHCDLPVGEPNEKEVLDMTTPKPALQDEEEWQDSAQSEEQSLQATEDKEGFPDETTSDNDEEELKEDVTSPREAAQEEEEFLEGVTSPEQAVEDEQEFLEGKTTSKNYEESLVRDSTISESAKKILILKGEKESPEDITASEETTQDQVDMTIPQPSAQFEEKAVKGMPEEQKLTLESLSIGFTIAKSLTDWFHHIDSSSERALKMKEGVDEALAPYRTLQEQLKYEKSQPKITKYFHKVVP